MNAAQLLDATVSGHGPRTVLFGNGFASSQRAWDAIVRYVPAGWRVVRFDYVGTTSATASHWMPERYETYEGHADDLMRLLVHLDVRDAVFVGHSMSGMIGALASVQAPDRLTHLLMIGASACYTDHAGYEGGFSASAIATTLQQVSTDVAAWMAGFGGRLIGRDAGDDQLRAYFRCFDDMRRDVAACLLHSILKSDYRALLPRVNAATTIVQAAEDIVVPRAAAEFLAAHTQCRRLHILPTAGHLPHVTHAERIIPILIDVLHHHVPAAHAPADTPS